MKNAVDEIIKIIIKDIEKDIEKESKENEFLSKEAINATKDIDSELIEKALKQQAKKVTHKTPVDNVNHPSHYTKGKFETIDVIQDNLTPEEFTGFCIGNVYKYLGRWRAKNGKEDLLKAHFYFSKCVNEMK